MTTHHWIKPYKGPFPEKEARELVRQIRDTADPEVNDIWDAQMRYRPQTDQYDVFVKTSK